MRVVIQRVTEASVTINQQIHGQIETGLIVLAGFEENDSDEDLHWISKKIDTVQKFICFCFFFLYCYLASEGSF